MTPRQPSNARAGFSLVEVAVCSIVVGVLIVAAMRAAGAAAAAQSKAAERAMAQGLASSLLAEITALKYEEPAPGIPLFGAEAPETLLSRANYDDVDDYNGWTEAAPRDRDGTALNAPSGWNRSVSVEWVRPADISSTSPTETGIKRITVTVRRGNVTLATAVALKSNAP